MANNENSVPFSETQIEVINVYGNAQNYPAMYQYIANEIKSGNLAVPGGIASDQYYWFNQAARINAGDTSSLSSVFIRSATHHGLNIDGLPTTPEYVQSISNNIGQNVYADLSRGELPPFSSQLQQDISSAINVGQMTIGGWGGSFYFWSAGYINPETGAATTVGNYILSNPTELEKFVEVNALAIADTYQQFGSTMYDDPDFQKAVSKGWENFSPFASGDGDTAVVGVKIFARAAAELSLRYGQEAVNELVEFLGDVMPPLPTSSVSGNYDALGNFIADLQYSFEDAETTTSPLILDLDGDGVETVSKTVGIHFDHDGNRFAETTGWVDTDDGLLAWDRNGDGKIDRGAELFGNQTILPNGSKAANGFSALAVLDANSDGKITASDTSFAQLRVWKDTDGNAMVSDGELLSLNVAGVQSLNVAFSTQTHTDAQGNQHLQVGQHTRTDGSTQALTDVWFATDTARTIDQDLVAVDSAIAVLPDLQGFGNVHSLHQAMSRDTSGELQSLLQNFLNAPDSNARHSLFQEILFVWTGTDGYALGSRGGNLDDGRKLYTLEAFLGENFVQDGVGSNPGLQAARELLDAYEQLSQTFYGKLMAQTHFASLYDGIGLTWNAATSAFDIDVSSVVDALNAKYTIDPAEGLAWMSEFGQGLQRSGDFGAQVLSALVQQGNSAGEGFSLHLSKLGLNHQFGNDSNNVLIGVGSGSNNLFGLDGDDQITGGSLSDIVVGGHGADILNGSVGSDTYVFNLGDGFDTINDYDTAANNDKVVFGSGIDANAIQLSRSGNDFTLGVNATDRVTVQGYFSPSSYGPRYRIETISFADGTTWDVATVMSKLTYTGTVGADDMAGISDFGNRISGLAGNDTITGGDKDDVLDGGSGNDILNGGYGNDTYVFNLGDGADTISDYESVASNDKLQFGAGITADAIQVSRAGNNLVLNIGGTDLVTVQNYMTTGSTGHRYRIETISFADGTNWDVATVMSKATYNGTTGADNMAGVSDFGNRISGLAGNDTITGGDKDDVLNGGEGSDTITGGSGNDTIEGGTGYDTIDGGYGNDTYVFNLGNGADTISDYESVASNDKLQFGAGITADAIQVSRTGNNLVLNIGGTDLVTVQNYMSTGSTGHRYRIETISFADGTNWDVATVMSKATYNGTTGADNMAGISDFSNRINALAGNDTITGGDKDDVLNGGEGNDILNGGYGSDTYVFNLGDGADTISDYESVPSNDKLQLGAGITADAIQVTRTGNNLVLNIGGSDLITMQNYMSTGSTGHRYRIETISFADGTNWDVATVTSKTTYNGTTGADSMTGISDFGNRINGLAGNDTITGGDKDDVLNGGEGSDTIYGGNGNDILISETGNDSLSGGYGNDVFKFIAPDQGADSISDFASGLDVIHIVGSNFGLSAGFNVTLVSSSTTPVPSNAGPQFLYNTTSGVLYFDKDGSESIYSPIQIVTLTGQKTLVAADLAVVA
ncbi:MAG TPA: calcium-binding protein [Noviherbaspirillum sp.]|nr:calcium-binding protein [Noviherbaspirillum sp.]